MTKTLTKKIIKYRDRTDEIETTGGILSEEINRGWILIDSEVKKIDSSDPSIISIEEFKYVLKNENPGLILG
jgi:hypothetical protein